MSENLLLISSLTPTQKQKIEQAGVAIFSPEDLGKKVAPADITILFGWDKEIGPKLLALPNSKLKWVHSISAGVDSLPLQEFAAKQIKLSNASGIHAQSISESVVAYILYFVRQLDLANQNKQKHHWAYKPELKAQTVDDFTYVVFGTGHIGQQIARLLKAFNATTIGVNTTGHPVNYFDQTVALDHLTDAVFNADVVINALPLTKETHYYFNQAFFNHFEQLFSFINIGRGPSVNTSDLIAALKADKVLHAGLDVFETEPLPEDNELWDLDQVVITPHTTGYISHFEDAQFKILWPNLQSFLQNQQLSVNEVKLDRGY